MSGLPLVSFVVPVRNDAAHLKLCLASIMADVSPRDSVEVLVADNGSSDDSADTARAAGARVLTLPGLTVAELRTRAAQEARGEFLAFVDADHQIAPGWTRSALETLTRAGVVAAGAPYHPPSDGTWVQRMYDTFRDHAEGVSDVEWLGSGNLVVAREAFLAVGGFNAALVTCEDVDLCQRLRAGGGRVVRDSRLRTTHFGDPATLRALFFGELWRGRNNFRVSFSTTPTMRGLPSIVIPMADLLLLLAGIVGLGTILHGGGWAALAAVVGVIALAVPRAAVMVSRLRTISVANTVQAMAVAVAYDVARALAPVWSGPHAARRRAEVR
jgi:GT2 family glycosyltransferase